MASCAAWLYWVGGLSILNSVIAMFGGDWQFSLGLGITSIVGYVAHDMGSAAKVIGLGVTLVASILLFLFGYQAARGHVWAFIAGIAVLALDTILLLLGGSAAILSIVFHAWAIYSLVVGLRLAVKLQQAPN
jgi:hypothetical protein